MSRDNITQLICISNVLVHEPEFPEGRIIKQLEVDKAYKAELNIEINNQFYHRVYLPIGGSMFFSRYLFMTLAEWREKQIDSIFTD